MDTKKDKRRFVYYILILFSSILVITSNLEAATLTVGSNSGSPGDRDILIPINLSSAPSEKASGFNFDLKFDTSRLSFKEVALGPKAKEAGKSLSHSQPKSNAIRVVVIGFNQNLIADGTALNFTFDILNKAPSGKAKMTITKPSISDPIGKQLSVIVGGGEVNVFK